MADVRQEASLIQDQSNQQFYALVWPHRADVLRVARFLCRDRSLADDLAQETLLKAFRSLGGLAGGRSVKAWLLVILRNTWTDRLRAGRHTDAKAEPLDGHAEIEAPIAAGGVDSYGDPQDLLEAFSDRDVIDALQALPEEIRWTLLLVDVEGVGVREAAELLGVPDGTIKSRAHRGRAMLRESLLPLARDRRMLTGDDGPGRGADNVSEPR